MATETYELCVDGVQSASYRSMVLHFSGVGVNSNDTLAAGDSLVTGFRLTCEAAMLAALPSSYSLMEYRARRATPKPSAVSRSSFQVAGVPGTGASTCTAMQTCPCIFLVPTMGVKSGGKIFFPAVPTGELDQNTFSGTWSGLIDTWMATMLSPFTQAGIDWQLAIFSRKLLTTSDVAGYHLSSVIGFQNRRRKPTGAV